MENTVNAILEGLNEEQRKAVQCCDGPVLIVAGAGSGKTRVLTSRIAYLLSKGVDPSRILALTFTKKAASEMKERIAVMVGVKPARRLVMGTFHSVFVRFLRDYAESLGYPSQFTIYDTSDSQSAMKACVKELQLDDKIYKPKEVLARISMAKNNLITVNAYKSNQQVISADVQGRKPRLADLYELYQVKLKQAGVMDFDDILVNMNILLRDNPAALEDIAGRFSHILVDEYQDTNVAQYLIMKKLSQFHRNVCVVGDDSQSIYAFRGAKIENILNFRKDYPECRTFRLERNYRSTQNIVNAANSVIAKNQGRIPKECYSEGEEGEKIRLLDAYTETEEAVQIVAEIMGRMRTARAQYQDFAILYRTNSQSRALEEQLRRRNIPYMIYSGNSFFERAEVKDLMAYFKLAVNPGDDESFKRAVNKPARGIGDTSVSALNEVARAHQCSLFKAAFMPDVEVYGLRAAAAAKIRQFCEMVDKFAVAVKDVDCYELAKRIADESGLYAFYKADTSIEGMARTANVEELVNSVQAFVEERQEEAESEILVTLDDFLENTALLSNVDVTEDEDTNNKVALMTVHSAKGLEFPYVFVAGMEENLFPSASMLMSLHDIEEERRLFYVAITRAKRAVALSFASTRMRNGKHESNTPSRFVMEIDPEYIENPEALGEAEEAAQSGAGFGARFGGFASGFRPSAGRPYSAASGRSGSAFGSGSAGFGSGARSALGGGSAFGSGGSASRSGSSRDGAFGSASRSGSGARSAFGSGSGARSAFGSGSGARSALGSGSGSGSGRDGAFGSGGSASGSRSAAPGGYAYGRSSGVTYEKRQPADFRQASGSRPTVSMNRPTTVTRSAGVSRSASDPRPAFDPRPTTVTRQPVPGRATSVPGQPASGPYASGRPYPASRPAVIDPDFVPVPMTELHVGQRIEHNRFGGGLIKSISGTAPEMKAVIDFDDYGEKLLLLKYAKLRPER